MLGFRILFLGVLGFLKKFPQAIAVSFLPAVACYLCLQIFIWLTPIQASFDASFWYAFFSFFFCTIPPLTWAWINWSRVAILQERPAFLPRLKGWAWVSATVRLAILVAIYMFFFAVIFAVADYFDTVVTQNQASELLFVIGLLGTVLVSYIFATWVFIRLILCLPAIGIADPVNFRKSWRQTADYTPTIIVISVTLLIALVLLFVGLIVTIPGRLDFLVNFMGFFWLFVFWLMGAITIAVPTELYSYIRAQNDVKQVFE